MLGARHASLQPQGLRSLIIVSSPASIHDWMAAQNELRSQIPGEVQKILNKHEAAGTIEDKEYTDAVQVYYDRHLCRAKPMPTDLATSMSAIETDPTVYLTMCVAPRCSCHF